MINNNKRNGDQMDNQQKKEIEKQNAYIISEFKKHYPTQKIEIDNQQTDLETIYVIIEQKHAPDIQYMFAIGSDDNQYIFESSYEILDAIIFDIQ